MSNVAGRTIVVVEDDAAALQAYGRLLARLGHEIVLRSGCEAALADTEGLRRADLLILDQQMPGIKGLDLLAALRGRGVWAARTAPPPVLLITAFADAALRRRATELGVTVIDKPVDAALLLGSVQNTLASAVCGSTGVGAAADGDGSSHASSLTVGIAEPYTSHPSAESFTGGIEESPSMKRHGQLFTLALIAAGSVIFGMVLAGGLNLTLPGRAAESASANDRPLHAAARAQLAAGRTTTPGTPVSFADIAEHVNPAVVSITATEIQQKSQRRQPFHGDPFEFFFGPQGPQGPQGPRRRAPQSPDSDEPDIEQSGGSGFLITDDGFIMTNYHVVESATKIRVNLSGDRRNYDAEVVGSDPSTDLALIKIRVDKKLPYLTFGDSEQLRIGDWVMAVGNPLQYEHTVTVGVVSAKGRRLGGLSRDASLDNFIQTDAAINFGNSGGPLVDMAGNVVGVNTAISSVGQGIGFAVPTSIARDVVDQLKSKGKVSRGFLGITVNEVSPDLQEAWGLTSDRGAVVQSVTPGMPADQAGLKRGDIITAIDGRDVATSDEVVRVISAKGPGSKVRLKVLRGGKELSFTANLGDREEGMGVSRTSGPGSETPKESNETKLGITTEDLSPQILQELGLPSDTDGVVVTRVSRVSEAYEKGVGDGDVITEVNRVPVGSLSDYRREIRKLSPGGLVVLYVISPPSRTNDAAISRYVTLRVVKED